MKSTNFLTSCLLVLVVAIETANALQPVKPVKTGTKLASTTTIQSPIVEPPIGFPPLIEEATTTTISPSSLIENPNQRRSSSFVSEPAIWKLAVAGALATLVSDIAMHPVDCIKTLQQSEQGFGLSMMAAAQVIYQQLGGLEGFYRGFLTYAACDAVAGAIKFGTYETLKRQVQAVLPTGALLSAALFGCASMSFATSSVIAVPGELLKQQLQIGHFTDSVNAISTIWQTNGLAGFYQGYDGVFLRDVPYTAMELGLYDLFKGLYISNKQQSTSSTQTTSKDDAASSLQTHEQIAIAGLTGGITGFLTNPVDVIKTKLMVDAHYEGADFMTASISTIQEHGWASLFAGADARVAWLVPLVAIYLPTYDFVKNSFANAQNDQSP